MPELTERVIEHYQNGPRAVILMSGAGSNAEVLLGNSELNGLYDIAAVCTDNPDSNARYLAGRFGKAYIEQPHGRFESYDDRMNYFQKLGSRLGSLGITAAFYAGFMRITPPEFCEDILGINVHPADLTITDEQGVALYRGMDALSAMRREVGEAAATVHVVDTPVDTGSALAVSRRLIPEAGESDNQLHKRLKDEEHIIFPRTLISLAEGRLAMEDLPVRY